MPVLSRTRWGGPTEGPPSVAIPLAGVSRDCIEVIDLIEDICIARVDTSAVGKAAAHFLTLHRMRKGLDQSVNPPFLIASAGMIALTRSLSLSDMVYSGSVSCRAG